MSKPVSLERLEWAAAVLDAMDYDQEGEDVRQAAAELKMWREKAADAAVKDLRRAEALDEIVRAIHDAWKPEVKP